MLRSLWNVCSSNSKFWMGFVMYFFSYFCLLGVGVLERFLPLPHWIINMVLRTQVLEMSSLINPPLYKWKGNLKILVANYLFWTFFKVEILLSLVSLWFSFLPLNLLPTPFPNPSFCKELFKKIFVSSLHIFSLAIRIHGSIYS